METFCAGQAEIDTVFFFFLGCSFVCVSWLIYFFSNWHPEVLNGLVFEFGNAHVLVLLEIPALGDFAGLSEGWYASALCSVSEGGHVPTSAPTKMTKQFPEEL